MAFMCSLAIMEQYTQIIIHLLPEACFNGFSKMVEMRKRGEWGGGRGEEEGEREENDERGERRAVKGER